MVITYHGGTFCKVSFGDTTLAFNPIGKASKLKQSKFGSDVALISQFHSDSNGVENVTHGDRQPFVIDGPGEYEIKGVTVRGFGTETTYGNKSAINTIYTVTLEGMRVCFLGTVENEKLSQEALEAIDTPDILFIPIGGEGTLGPARAHALSVKLGAHVIIPIAYNDATLKKFLKEDGNDNIKPVEKLTLKKKDVDSMDGEIIVLKA